MTPDLRSLIFDRDDQPLRGPRDLPDLRVDLMRRWRPGGDFFELLRLSGDRDPERPDLPAATKFCAWALPKAALWWVSADMSSLVDRAAKSLPSTTLTRELIPDDWGLVYFASPLEGVDAELDDAVIFTQMVLWGPVFIPPADGDVSTPRSEWLPAVQMSFFGRSDDTIPWHYQGGTDWFLGVDTEEPTATGFDDRHRVSMAEDRRRLAALWLLAAQPLAESSVTRVTNRAKARRLAKARVSGDVRVVNVRRRAPTGEESAGSESGGRTYSRRWVVEGFWRQQACGPGWSQHRPVFIESHVRGPADKPLVVRETVKVLRGDDRRTT